MKILRAPEKPSTALRQDQYALAPDVLLVIGEDHTARLLNLDGRFYAVSAVGAQMLEATLLRGAAAAVQFLAAHYHVDPPQIHRDLDDFLRELERQRLICRPHARWPKLQLRARIAALLLAPALHALYRGSWSLHTRTWLLLTVARLTFPLFGWAHTVAAWQRYHQTHEADLTPAPDEHASTVLDEAVRAAAARHLLPMGCKERAVCSWSLAYVSGLPATLVVGMHRVAFHGHCWCEVGQWIIGDDHDRCEQFVPVLRYPFPTAAEEGGCA